MGLHGKGWIGMDRDGMGADGEAAAKRAKIESNQSLKTLKKDPF
jgi:hypothetical protein